MKSRGLAAPADAAPRSIGRHSEVKTSGGQENCKYRHSSSAQSQHFAIFLLIRTPTCRLPAGRQGRQAPQRGQGNKCCGHCNQKRFNFDLALFQYLLQLSIQF
jgi:hypothetical protein